jgi:hypothetical protein
MLSYTRRMSFVAIAFLLAACDQSAAPTAPRVVAPRTASNAVERMQEEYISTFDGSFTQFVCEDGTESELVELFGQIYHRNSSTYNPSGAILVTSHSMPIGLRGVGTVSGQEYRVREQEHMAVSQREIGYAGTLRQVFVLTAQESMETFKLVTIAHYVVTPDGKVVVQRQTEHSECAK